MTLSPHEWAWLGAAAGFCAAYGLHALARRLDYSPPRPRMADLTDEALEALYRDAKTELLYRHPTWKPMALGGLASLNEERYSDHTKGDDTA